MIIFISQQILAFLIDNGFMRKNEPEKVIERLKQNGMNVKLVDARYTFYNATTTLHPKNNKGKEKKVRKLIKMLNINSLKKFIK